MPRIQAIYAHHVLHSTGTFEEIPPTLDEMTARLQAIHGKGLPWLVAEQNGAVEAMGYAGPYRPRSAYRFTVEDSVYVAKDAQAQGLGKKLLSELIARCQALGMRQMLAVIGDSGNQASIALHRACGFTHAGIAKSVGFKHGRWLDTVWMQRSLQQ